MPKAANQNDWLSARPWWFLRFYSEAKKLFSWGTILSIVPILWRKKGKRLSLYSSFSIWSSCILFWGYLSKKGRGSIVSRTYNDGLRFWMPNMSKKYQKCDFEFLSRGCGVRKFIVHSTERFPLHFHSPPTDKNENSLAVNEEKLSSFYGLAQLLTRRSASTGKFSALQLC